MVTVVFEHVHVAAPAETRPREPLRGEAPPGSRLMDVCDELEAPVPFSCRDASCGTCLVQVRFGAELLAPPDDVERRTLLRMGAAADQRLACRARLFGAAGLLTIRSVA